MSSSVSLHVTCSWSKASGETPAPSIAKKFVTDTRGVTRTTSPGTARAPTQLVAPIVTTSGSAVAWMTSRSPAALTSAARVSRSSRTGPERPCSGIGGSSMVIDASLRSRRSRPRQVELAVAGEDVLPAELRQLVLAAVELVLDERVDVVVPDAAQRRRLVEAGAHEVAVPDLQVGAAEGPTQVLVDAVDEVGHPHWPVVGLEPATQQALHGPVVRHERDEVEASAQGGVDEGDRAVGGVHGADEVEVGRQLEALVGPVARLDRVRAVLEQEEQLAEDARQVRAVDLVDDHDVRRQRVGLGRLGEERERALAQLVDHLALVVDLRPEALEEVLVAAARVELDDVALGRVGLQGLREPLGEVGLAGAGRAVEDDLLLLLEQALDLAEEVLLDEQLRGGLAEGVVVGHERLVGTAHEHVRELRLAPRVVRQQRVERLLEQGVGLDVRAAAGLALGPARRPAEAAEHRDLAGVPAQGEERQPVLGVRDGEELEHDALAEALDRDVVGAEHAVDPLLVAPLAPEQVAHHDAQLIDAGGVEGVDAADEDGLRADVAVAARRHDPLEGRQVEGLEPVPRQAGGEDAALLLVPGVALARVGPLGLEDLDLAVEVDHGGELEAGVVEGPALAGGHEAQQRRQGPGGRDDVVGEVGASDGLVALPPAADEGLAAGVLAPDGLEPVGATVLVDAQEAEAAREVLLDDGADLAVLLVALALPAAVQSERDARRGDPEAEAGGAGASDEDPRGIQVGAVGGVLARMLLQREGRGLEVEARLGGEAVDEAVADVVGLAAQLAREVGRAVLSPAVAVAGRRAEVRRDLGRLDADVEHLGRDPDERLGLLEVPEDASGILRVLGAQGRAEVGEGDVALRVAQAALEPAEPLEHVRGVLPHERPLAAVVGGPEEREHVCRVAGSGGALAARATAGEEGLHGLELVAGVLRGGRGLEGELEQADDLGVLLLGAAHERGEPRAADGAEADVGTVLAGPLVHRLLEGDEVAGGHEVGEDLAQLAVAGGPLGVELGEEGLGVLVRLGGPLDEGVLGAPTLEVDGVSARHGAPLHAHF